MTSGQQQQFSLEYDYVYSIQKRHLHIILSYEIRIKILSVDA